MEKKSLRDEINNFIIKVARYIELFMSCVITLVIVFMIIQLTLGLPEALGSKITNETFNEEFLSVALSLVVGIEFVKMLSHYSPETIIEVLMLATARQMVVEHLGPTDTLIGTFAMAVLFAIRKFLFVPEHGSHDSEKKNKPFSKLLKKEIPETDTENKLN